MTSGDKGEEIDRGISISPLKQFCSFCFIHSPLLSDMVSPKRGLIKKMLGNPLDFRVFVFKLINSFIIILYLPGI